MTNIYQITPFTMLDYTDHLACIVWFCGCNMRCQYCHNPQIVESKGQVGLLELKNFLQSRIGKLDAVVLSGGEATLTKELPEICSLIKSMGFKIKLDTNGTNPKMLEKLVNANLLDYIALDYKAPESKFCEITDCKHWKKFYRSLKFLLSMQDRIKIEVRTTWHSQLLEENDIQEIINDLEIKGYKNKLYLQNCNLVGSDYAFAELTESSKVDITNLKTKQIKVEIR